MLKLLLFQKEILPGYKFRRGNASRYPTPGYKFCRGNASRYPTPGYKFCRDNASRYPEHYFGGKDTGH
jgi:hypothetical protein